MISGRLFFSLVLSSALSFAAVDTSVAQSLSDSSSALNAGRSNGYMALGGNLGRAIAHRRSPRTPPLKSAKTSRIDRHAAHQRAHPQLVGFRPTRDAPMFLVAQSLDNSGLTINTLRP